MSCSLLLVLCCADFLTYKIWILNSFPVQDFLNSVKLNVVLCIHKLHDYRDGAS
jgi:hypothetical protein